MVDSFTRFAHTRCCVMIIYHLYCHSPHSGFPALFSLSGQDDWTLAHRRRSMRGIPQIWGGGGGPRGGAQLPHFVAENNANDITCGIGDIKTHILCPQRRLKNYLRSTMKQDGLNNCLQMHCHKSITDTQDTVKIAKRFTCANEQRKGHLRKFEQGYAQRWVKDEPPHPLHVSKCSAASVA